ncbi:MAG: VWA domain-containing protein [Candidatus Omnitrophica bacterium]|nr:VWA domain-containing protein [Candidatus Omnitrophota bacterium]
MEFRTPFLLLLIPFVIPILVWMYTRQRPPTFIFSSVQILKGLRVTWKMRLRHLPFLLRIFVVLLFIVALSGPRKPLAENKAFFDGIDIVLLVDTSTSMAAEDFTINGKQANRLEAIKNVVRDFVDKRKGDRIALISFAALPYTVCPLTTDHGWLQENLARINFGMMEDGTAIGSAIASGANRLRFVEGKSKVIILLTDGINNRGKMDPLKAAEAAQALGVRIYTIGAGTLGEAPYPVTDIFGRRGYQNVPVEIDEDTLKAIAQMTGGQYFRATDTASLKAIYEQIDKMEKVKFEEHGYQQYEEFFSIVLFAALLILLLEVLLSRTLFLKIP